jgi:hypothetical protein
VDAALFGAASLAATKDGHAGVWLCAAAHGCARVLEWLLAPERKFGEDEFDPGFADSGGNTAFHLLPVCVIFCFLSGAFAWRIRCYHLLVRCPRVSR